MTQKKIPIQWLIEMLANNNDPTEDSSATEIAEGMIKDLLIMGLLDESRICTLGQQQSEILDGLGSEVLRG